MRKARNFIILGSLLYASAAWGQCDRPVGGLVFYWPGQVQTATTFTVFFARAGTPLPEGTVFEILLSISPDYCTARGPFQVFGRTTQSSYTFAKPLDAAFSTFVRLRANPCVSTSYSYSGDSYPLPSLPVIIGTETGTDYAKLLYKYREPRSVNVKVERAGADGFFHEVAYADHCLGGVKTFVDHGLRPGFYRYRIKARSFASGEVFSKSVSVTVGAPNLNFAAVPTVIHEGQVATLLWTTEGDVHSVLIEPDVGVINKSQGARAVSPKATTKYTITTIGGAVQVSSSETVTVIKDARVRITSMAPPMMQPPGLPGASTKYVLTNTGGLATNVQLSQNGSFFTHSPTSFSLTPGSSQVVTISAHAQSAGVFEGASIPAGTGVPSGLAVPIKLLSALSPGIATARPFVNRVDVAGPVGSSSAGFVAFRNAGETALTGVVSSDAPWLIPQSGALTIPAGLTASVPFVVDRSQRPDVGAAFAGVMFSSPSASALVTVSDTVQPPVTIAPPPALASGEVALFVPGVGHVAGSVGIFLSDFSLFNQFGGAPVDDATLYYTPVGGALSASRSAALSAIDAGEGMTLTDIAKTVFGSEGQVGSLQIRSREAKQLTSDATIFSVSNPAGTCGTLIPTFRSDRAAGPGGQVVLVGLRRDGTRHTNLFIQETKGLDVEVTTAFFASDGTSRGTRTDQVGPFALLQINNVVPAGAVSAILTNSSAAGDFLAYATPVDEASGDNWSVVDWNRQYPSTGSATRVIPVAGAVHGANGTYFRTEVALMNRGTTAGRGTLRYVSRTGEVTEREIILGVRQSMVVDDVIGTFFGIATDTVGFLVFTPLSGDFVVTSRIYTTAAGQSATFGTGVPAVPLSAALKLGELRTIRPLEDAAIETITAARPATFRTNLVLVETGGGNVRVRLTLQHAVGSASKEYDLAPNQFLFLNGLATEIMGSARAAFGDLHDLELHIHVIDGDGSVMAFASTVDNGSGDSILR